MATKTKPAQTIDFDEPIPQSVTFDEAAPAGEEEEAKPQATAETLPGARPALLKQVNTGVLPMAPPTKFEEERKPEKQQGFLEHGLDVLGNQIGSFAKSSVAPYTKGYETYEQLRGAGKGVIPSMLGGAAMGVLRAAPGSDLIENTLERPEEYKERRGAGYGRAYSALAPIAAEQTNVNLPSMEHQADIGNARGVLAEAAVPAAELAGGEAIHAAPKGVRELPGALVDKVVRGTPLTEAGRLEAATKQALTVKKPSMTETDYAARVQQAVPDLQKIAQDNPGQLKTPRQSVAAFNKRIGELESPISEHLKTLTDPEEMLQPTQYQEPILRAIDAEFAKDPGLHKPEEIAKAKKLVGDYLGDQPKSVEEIENNRKRLNQDASAYYQADTAGKRAIDVSDATARAQRAAANAIRDVLYGDEANPGVLEKVGVTANDTAGNPINVRELRTRVGNLIELRDHFEDAIVKAEETGDWKPFHKLFTGPSIAAGGLGMVAGAAAGGPLGALLGTLAGEGAKAWGDYLRTKNPNLNVQKMWRNLENTTPKPTIEVGTAGPRTALTPGPVQGAARGALPAPAVEAPWHVGEDTSGPTRNTDQGQWVTPRAGIPEIAASRFQPHGLLPGIGELAPRAEGLPMPGTAALAHPEMIPEIRPTGELKTQVARDPRTGRMFRVTTGEPKPPIVGQTAEGGPIREGETPAPTQEREPVASRKAEGLIPTIGGPGREGLIKSIVEEVKRELETKKKKNQ